MDNTKDISMIGWNLQANVYDFKINKLALFKILWNMSFRRRSCLQCMLRIRMFWYLHTKVLKRLVKIQLTNACLQMWMALKTGVHCNSTRETLKNPHCSMTMRVKQTWIWIWWHLHIALEVLPKIYLYLL